MTAKANRTLSTGGSNRSIAVERQQRKENRGDELPAGLHARNRWRLPVLLAGMLLASGRRTVTTWLRAAGVSDDFPDDYYVLACLGRKSESISTQLVALLLQVLPLPKRVLLVIDGHRPKGGPPTKRYGPKVEGADPAKPV